jgi:hypothetical protein
MTVTFGGVTLPIPQLQSEEYTVTCNETLLDSGKYSIQATTEYGKHFTFSCIGTSTARDDLLAKIGTSTSLVINGTTYANCYIRSLGPVEKITMTNYFTFNIAFAQDTSIT